MESENEAPDKRPQNGNGRGVSIELLAVDPKAEDDGEWVGCPEFGTDEQTGEALIAFKVRSSSCPAFEKLRAKLSRPLHKKFGATQILDPQMARKVVADCLVEVGLIDWRGINDADGQPIPYSKEFASILLHDRRYRKIQDAIAAAAQSVGDADSAWRSDLGKASAPSSNGG